MDFVSAFGPDHGEGSRGIAGHGYAKPLVKGTAGAQTGTFGEIYANYEVSPSGMLASQRRSFMCFAARDHHPKICTIREKTQPRSPGRYPAPGSRVVGPKVVGSWGEISTPRKGRSRPLSQPGTPRQVGLRAAWTPPRRGLHSGAAALARYSLPEQRDELPRAAVPQAERVPLPESVAQAAASQRHGAADGGTRPQEPPDLRVPRAATRPSWDPGRANIDNGEGSERLSRAEKVGGAEPAAAATAPAAQNQNGSKENEDAPAPGGATSPRAASFIRLNDFLLRTHVNSLLCALAEAGHIEPWEKERMCRIARSGESRSRMPGLLKAYAQFVETSDLTAFVTALRALL